MSLGYETWSHLMNLLKMPARTKTHNQRNSATWLTLLTIKIDTQKRCFTPSFRCKLKEENNSLQIPCSCGQLRAWNTRSSLPAVACPFPLECNTPRFVFDSLKETEEAKMLCVKAAKYNGKQNFMPKVISLLRELSKLCKGKRINSKVKSIGDTTLRPFTDHSLNHESISNDLQRTLRQPLTKTEVQSHGLGYIYILRSQNFSTLAELKIGFSKYHPEHRAHELARCLENPQVIAHSPRLPHARRVELIIHTELKACRKVKYCAQCQRNHQEFFTISHIDSREIVIRWSRWMLHHPYRDGILTQRWQNHLSIQNFKESNDRGSLQEYWNDVIESCPPESSEWSGSEEMGSYMNAIWSDQANDRTETAKGLSRQPENFEEFHAAMHARKRKITGGLGFGSFPLDASALDALFDTDSEAELSKKPRRILRSNTLNRRNLEEAQERKEGYDFLEHLLSIKTGSISVSHPDLGICESPLGDATMLPVIQLNELDYMDPVVKVWMGYTPTHTGYQALQEAYQRGEWDGQRPRFQRTGALRSPTKIYPGIPVSDDDSFLSSPWPPSSSLASYTSSSASTSSSSDGDDDDEEDMDDNEDELNAFSEEDPRQSSNEPVHTTDLNPGTQPGFSEKTVGR